MIIDNKTKKLAKIVVNYSVAIKHDENVIIAGSMEAEPLIYALYQEVIKKGGHPILRLSPTWASFAFYQNAKDHHIEKFPEHFDFMVKNAQKYIGIYTDFNTRELTAINPQKIVRREQVTRPIQDYIVNEHDKIKRCTVGYPCVAFAQEAEMSLEHYEDFVFKGALLDWPKLSIFWQKILNRFRNGKKVKLIGKNIDLEFEINGKLAQLDDGCENMPGGEIFMAPVFATVNGKIKFEYPSLQDGKMTSGIDLEFKNGRVIKAKAEKNEKYLRKMISVDKNAGRVGEFGIGLNPKIKKVTNNILFDEKIIGTIHLALGMAYKQNGGGNDSTIHWDLIKDMKKAKIILDNKIIQENGDWIIDRFNHLY